MKCPKIQRDLLDRKPDKLWLCPSPNLSTWIFNYLLINTTQTRVEWCSEESNPRPTHRSECTHEISRQKRSNAMTSTTVESNDHSLWFHSQILGDLKYQSSISPGGHPRNSPATDFTATSPRSQLSIKITLSLTRALCLRTSQAWATYLFAESCQTFVFHPLRRNSWASSGRTWTSYTILSAPCR